MKPQSNVVLAIAAAAALAFSVAAHQSSKGNDQNMSGMQGMPDQQRTPMKKMMQMCRRNMGPMMQSNDQLKKDIEAAKQSNDPSKIRAALDEAEQALDSLTNHMSNCMSMMNKMQNMRGTSGKMCGEMASGQQNNDH